jgi:chromosome segregation ATPase
MGDSLERLRTATQSLRAAIEWLKAAQPADPQAALQHLRRLSTSLSLGREVIRQPECSAGEEMQEAICQYRDCLQRLQEALSFLRSDLVAQRSNLRPELEQTEAAMQWLSRTQSTLG